MNRFLKYALWMALVILAAAAGTGCERVGREPASGADNRFKMYSEPGVTPDPYCDPYVELHLDVVADSGTVSLDTNLEGICELAVISDPREYALRHTGDNCGSRIFEGRVTSGGKRYDRIKIIDHRTRLCRDLVPAPIIVTEIHADSSTATLYSALRGGRSLYVGVIQSHAAIGGESTGIALSTEGGEVIELEMSDGDRRRYAEGSRVTVEGRLTLVSGVEIPTRRVLVVEKIRSLD